MLPTDVFIDTSGVSVDRKVKKLSVLPKEPIATSNHRSGIGRNRITTGSSRATTQGGL